MGTSKMSPEKREFKMNKKCAFLAVAGLVVLTGCGPKIMSQRVYTPSDAAGQVDNADGKAFGEVPAAENTPTAAPDIAARPFDGAPAAAPAPAPAQNYNGYAPMEGSNAPAGLSGKSAPKKSSGKKVYAKGGTYVVKSGDTLGSIARRHGVSLGALLEANKMTMQDAKKLTVGRKLVIPAAGKKAVSGKKGASAAPAAAAEKGYYIVQRGDFPQKIARKNKVKLADLLKANNLTMDSARRLQIGQKLIIPGKTATQNAEPEKISEPNTVTGENTTVTSENTTVTSEPGTVTGEPNTVTGENTTVTSENTTVSETVTTTPTDGGDADSEIQMVPIEADTTAAELAVKYNVAAESISQKNSGKTEFIKGDIIFIPKK